MWIRSCDLSDSVGKEVLGVGGVPRLPREKWNRPANRKEKEPNLRLEVRRKVWESPPPRVATPRDQIFIGEEVTSPTIFVLSLGTAKAVQQVAYEGPAAAWSGL